MTKIEYDNERMCPSDPNLNPQSLQKHKKRYEFAAELLKNKSVLDTACGCGYGSSILAGTAKKVIGVDLSEQAIEYAKKHYKNNNLEYMVMDCTNLKFRNNTFDAVVSFEFIEHLGKSDQKRYTAEAARVIKPSGILIMSTPNKKRYKCECPAHVREMYLEEFHEMLLENFKSVEMYGQLESKISDKSISLLPRFVKRLVPPSLKKNYSKANPPDFMVKRAAEPEKFLHFVAICKKV